MRITIDRIEGDRAVLELAGDAGVELIDVPLSALPPGVGEGQQVQFVRIESLATEAEARLARLKARSPQGPGSFDL